ncbi:MAG: hypothetical protein COT73_02690, partial [Bdellovibrio sp. CG10_big_fil_rev_8_21_14_0_10_47_8]
MLVLFGNSSLNAASFADDFFWIQEAQTFLKGKTPRGGLGPYLDPYKGPTQFRLSEQEVPWAGNYFPMEKGGIAQRWQQGKSVTKILAPSELKTLSADQLSKLSPVEKFDLLMNYSDFRTTDFELNRRGPLRDPKPDSWEGFCNGVRCAGILMPEPKYPVEVVNAKGLSVTFQPSDLKALAGASYFFVEEYAQIGSPSEEGKKAQAQPNPAVFDLVLRYNLATKKKAFVIDSNLGEEIWNETVVGYKRDLSSAVPLTAEEKKLFPQAESKVSVKLYLETLGEIEIVDANGPTKHKVAQGQSLSGISTGYDLFLDKSGNAIDGVWKNKRGDRGVDFAWFVAGDGADQDYVHKGGNPYLDFKAI